MYSTQLLKTLSVSEPEQLVELGCVNTNEPDKLGCNTSYPGFRMFRDENEVLSGLFAFAPAGELNAIYNGEAELVHWSAGNWRHAQRAGRFAGAG